MQQKETGMCEQLCLFIPPQNWAASDQAESDRAGTVSGRG